MDVDKKFKKMVADVFRTDIKKIKNSTKFLDDLHAKSIDMIAVIAATENNFNIKTNSAETSKNKTVGQAIVYIKKKMKEKK